MHVYSKPLWFLYEPPGPESSSVRQTAVPIQGRRSGPKSGGGGGGRRLGVGMNGGVRCV